MRVCVRDCMNIYIHFDISILEIQINHLQQCSSVKMYQNACLPNI